MERLGINTRALIRKCEESGLTLLTIPVQGRTPVQPFVRMADLPHLTRLAT